MLAKFFAKLIQILAPWLIDGVWEFLKAKVKEYREHRQKLAEKKALDEALAREKQAVTKEDQENAFKDVVDRTNGT